MVWALCILSGISGLVTGVWQDTVFLPFFALAAYVALWSPRVVLLPDRAEVTNPLRVWTVPWSAVAEVESRWTVSLVTPSRRIAIWALPRDSRAASYASVRRDQYGLPDFAAQQQFERQSGPGSAGAGLLAIERHLGAFHESNESSPAAPPISRLRVPSVVALTVLLAAGIVVEVLAR